MSIFNEFGRAMILVTGLVIAVPSQVAAQSSVPDVVSICGPVINAEYEGDMTPWGACVTAVEAFLQTVPAGSDQLVSLVVALTELYRADADCRIADTELPLAIARAADFAVDDEDQQAQILTIRDTVETCDTLVTATINRDPQGSAF